MLLVFEGIDGCGKTALSKLIMKKLSEESKNADAVWFKNPTDMKWGHAIRSVFEKGIRLHPEVESAMFRFDRRENVDLQIVPALEEGKTVLQDRYYFSTAAYQGAAGLDWKEIVEENEKFCVRPDIVFFLSITPKEALSRIDKDGRGRTAPEKLDVQIEIDKVYREMFDTLGRNGVAYKIIKLDATKSLEDLVNDVMYAM